VDLVIAGFSQVSSAPAAACAGGAEPGPAPATLFVELLDQLGVADCGPVVDVREGANVSTEGETARGRAASGDPVVADGAAADADDESEEDDVAPDVTLIMCTAQPRHALDADVPVVPRIADNADLSGVADRADLPEATQIADCGDLPDFKRGADLSRVAEWVGSPDSSRASDLAELPEFSPGADRADLPNFRHVADHRYLPDFTPVTDGADLPDLSRLADRANLPAALTHAKSDPSALTTERMARDVGRQSRVHFQPHYARALARALAGVATERSAEVPSFDGQHVREPGARVDEASAVRTAASLESLVTPVAQSQLAEPRPIAMPETKRPMAGEHEIVPQLVRAMRAQFRAGVGEARIRLNPEHLGEVRVAITIDGDRVSALLQVERPEVRRAIESQSDSLRSGLAAQGFTLEHLSVSRDDRARHPHPSGDDLEHRGRNPDQRMPQRRSKKRPYDEIFDVSDD
jgi:hypothetical protein